MTQLNLILWLVYSFSFYFFWENTWNQMLVFESVLNNFDTYTPHNMIYLCAIVTCCIWPCLCYPMKGSCDTDNTYTGYKTFSLLPNKRCTSSNWYSLDTHRPLSMRGTWKDSTACFCRTTNRMGLSKPCDNTSTDTRTPSVWNPKIRTVLDKILA